MPLYKVEFINNEENAVVAVRQRLIIRLHAKITLNPNGSAIISQLV